MSRIRSKLLGTVLTGVLLIILGCAQDQPTSPTETIPQPMLEHAANLPDLNPEYFVSVIDNPYLPYTPGKTFFYAGKTRDGMTETNEVFVTHDTKVILGVTTTVVLDQVRLDGELTEETLDWYAQDQDGNVWYFGEDSKSFENGEVVSTEGSWEAGKDGASPGIVMLGNPKVGMKYPQEIAPEVAEDMAKVISLRKSVSVSYGDFGKCLQTKEWTRLAPGTPEFKFYAPGVGLLFEVAPTGDPRRVELTKITM